MVLGVGRGTAGLAPKVKAGVVAGAVAGAEVGAVEMAVARVVDGGLAPKVKAGVGVVVVAVVGVAAGGLAPKENAGAAEVGVVEAIEGAATGVVSVVVLGPGIVEGAELDFDPKENEGAAVVDTEDDGTFDEGEAGVLPKTFSST